LQAEGKRGRGAREKGGSAIYTAVANGTSAKKKAGNKLERRDREWGELHRVGRTQK